MKIKLSKDFYLKVEDNTGNFNLVSLWKEGGKLPETGTTFSKRTLVSTLVMWAQDKIKEVEIS